MDFALIRKILSVFISDTDNQAAQCLELEQLIAPDIPKPPAEKESEGRKKRIRHKRFQDYFPSDLYRFINGNRPPPKALADYLLQHWNSAPLIDRIYEADPDVKLATINTLRRYGFITESEALPEYLADLVLHFFQNIAAGKKEILPADIPRKDRKGNLIDTLSLDAIQWIDGRLAAGPHLTDYRRQIRQCIPKTIDSREKSFLKPLMEIISEQEGQVLTIDDIQHLPDKWQRYIDQNRRCYHAAAGFEDFINRTFLTNEGPPELKYLLDDVYGGIEDIYFDEAIASGYERLKHILIHLTKLPLTGSLACHVMDFIDSDVRRGFAHLLVCHGYISSWVKIYE